MNYNTRQPSAYMLESNHSICYPKDYDPSDIYDQDVKDVKRICTFHPDVMPQCIAEAIHTSEVSRWMHKHPAVIPNKSTYSIRRADNCPF